MYRQQINHWYVYLPFSPGLQCLMHTLAGMCLPGRLWHSSNQVQVSYTRHMTTSHDWWCHFLFLLFISCCCFQLSAAAAIVQILLFFLCCSCFIYIFMPVSLLIWSYLIFMFWFGLFYVIWELVNNITLQTTRVVPK